MSNIYSPNIRKAPIETSSFRKILINREIQMPKINLLILHFIKATHTYRNGTYKYIWNILKKQCCAALL